MSLDLNSNQIIRNFQLCELTDMELEEPHLSIYLFLENIFKDLKIYDNISSVRSFGSDVIYYGKIKGELYIRRSLRNGKIWLSYDKIWSILRHHYHLSYNDIKLISQWVIQKFLHLKVNSHNQIGYTRYFPLADSMYLKL